jgi:hypothetical protein
MTWKKTSSILNARINHHGLGSMVAAGQICMEAERLMPDLFQAISFRSGILHLRLKKANLLAVKMGEGPLIENINRFSKDHNLPPIVRLRLTFTEE